MATVVATQDGPEAEVPARVLPLTIFVLFASTAVYFAGTAVAPALAVEWSLDLNAAGALTWAVQAGFIAGTLVAAALNLPDRFAPQRVIAALLALAAAANWAFTLAEGDMPVAIFLRFAAGALAGPVYPIGMKLLATWYSRLGLELGVLIGAYTAGAGAGFLLQAASVRWDVTLLAASGLGVAGAAVSILALRAGPLLPVRSRFDLKAGLKAFRVQAYRRSAFGYFGHMWELFAFWALLPFWLSASGIPPPAATALAGIVFVAGALGCVLAGGWSRRVGEARVARVALAISGICCLVSPLLFAAPLWLVAPFIVLWGGAAVADSGMFSSISARAAPRGYVGTALTTQNSIGFSITIVSISLLPLFVNWAGSWQYAMLLLAPGPLLGLIPVSGIIRNSQ